MPANPHSDPLGALLNADDLANKHTIDHPDTYLNALLDYTKGLYGAMKAAGMKPREIVDAMQHIERAARGLHKKAIAAGLGLAKHQTRDSAARAAYMALQMHLDDPWDAVTRRRIDLGMTPPFSANQMRAFSVVDAVVTFGTSSTKLIRDPDAVCTTCRWKGDHAPGCPASANPWPMIEVPA